MDYLEYLKTRVKEKRYIHTLGVIDEAIIYAKRYGADTNKARVAATLHDLEKYTDINYQRKIVDDAFKGKYGYLPDQVLHGFSASITVKDLGIDDEDIINAIRFHTTGRPNMSELEKIIYLADFTDPSRNSEIGKIVHELTLKSLDDAFLYTLEFMVNKLRESNEEISAITLNALEYYKEKKHEGNTR